MMQKKILTVVLMLFTSIQLFAADYYWVGGAGNWSDINHWRTASGGNLAPSVIPGPTDNIFFDVNSGFTVDNNIVIIDVIAHCKNIVFSGNGIAPIVKEADPYYRGKVLNIHGSSEWQLGMGIDIGSIHYHNTSVPKTMTMNGAFVNANIIIDETSTMNLVGDFNNPSSLLSSIFINAGTFNTNNYNIYSANIIANNATPKTINLGTSTVIGKAKVNFNRANLTLNAAQSFVKTNYLEGYANQVYDKIQILATRGSFLVGGVIANEVIYDQYGEGYIGGGNKIKKVTSYSDYFSLYDRNTVEELILYRGGKIENNNNIGTAEVINGDLTIHGNNQFKKLTLASAYNFYVSGTQTITELFSFENSDCMGWSLFKGILSPYQSSGSIISVFNMPSNAIVKVNAVNMSDITATGGATFTATNTLDYGNNTGWTYTSSPAKTLYWVGGSGNWNDTAHWSLTPNGIGGDCTPGPNDDVIFGSNSGLVSGNNTVTIDKYSYARNVTFQNNPSAPILNGNEIDLYGSLILQNGMSVSNAGIVYKNTNSAKTIKTNGAIVNTNIVIDETTTFDFLDDFNNANNLFSALYVQAGTLNTNNYNIYLAHIIANNATPKTINFGTSTVVGLKKISFSSANLTLNAAQSFVKTNYLEGYANQVYDKIQIIATRGCFITGGIIANEVIWEQYAEGTVRDFNKIKKLTSYSSSFNLFNGNSIEELILHRGGTITTNNTFDKVQVISGGLTIHGNNQFKKLILAPEYDFNFSGTQTITELLSFENPDCMGWSLFKGVSSEYQSSGPITAVLSMPLSAVVKVNAVNMSNVKATGGAVFVATNALDYGGNTGWTYTSSPAKTLYWVGGSGNWNDTAHWSLTPNGIGGDCTPGPNDDVIFGTNSGLINGSNVVTIDKYSYARNVTFQNNPAAPILNGTGIDLYGSLTLQNGMIVSNEGIVYKNTNSAKTIKTNGAIVNTNIVIDETTTFDFLDDFNNVNNLFSALYVQAGTLNTNNYNIYSAHIIANNATPKTINLGTSTVVALNVMRFNTPNLTLNAAQSFVKTRFLDGYTNQVYDKIQILATRGSFLLGGIIANEAIYDQYGEGYIGGGNRIKKVTSYSYNFSLYNGNTIEELILYDSATIEQNNIIGKAHFIFGNANFKGNNQFTELILAEGSTNTFDYASIQQVGKLALGGNPCFLTYIVSSRVGTQAKINVTESPNNFNFAFVRDINAIGNTLHFGEQSTVANQNNTNVTSDPYNPGAFEPLGEDWLCHEIVNTDPNTYIISGLGFYGNSNTSYKWYKIAGDNASTSTVISTTRDLDIQTFGYGTYRVEVIYSEGTSVGCFRFDEINIVAKTDLVVVGSDVVCQKGTNTLADINVNGTNVKWYSSSSSSNVLPLNTVIQNGETYYVSQIIDGCESNRTVYNVNIKSCINSRVNPNNRMRVSQ